MPFVKRNQLGAITAVSTEPADGFQESVDENSTELKIFLETLGVDAEFSQSDIDFVRVLEDLMSVLMDKQVFLFTELPQEAQQKLLKRHALRNQRRDSLNLLEDDDLI